MKVTRDYLRASYKEWNHIKKGGLEHISNQTKNNDREDELKSKLQQEINKLEELISNAQKLTEELNQCQKTLDRGE